MFIINIKYFSFILPASVPPTWRLFCHRNCTAAMASLLSLRAVPRQGTRWSTSQFVLASGGHRTCWTKEKAGLFLSRWKAWDKPDLLGILADPPTVLCCLCAVLPWSVCGNCSVGRSRHKEFV